MSSGMGVTVTTVCFTHPPYRSWAADRAWRGVKRRPLCCSSLVSVQGNARQERYDAREKRRDLP